MVKVGSDNSGQKVIVNSQMTSFLNSCVQVKYRLTKGKDYLFLYLRLILFALGVGVEDEQI